MTDEAKTKRLNEIEKRLKTLYSNLEHAKTPIERREIRSNIGRLYKERYAIENNMVN